jgi:hypothetical protein
MIQHKTSNKYGMCSFSRPKIKQVKQLANANSRYAIMIFSAKANMTFSTNFFNMGTQLMHTNYMSTFGCAKWTQ